jgi:hypothetical protein
MTQFAMRAAAPSKQGTFVIDGKTVIASASDAHKYCVHTLINRDVNAARHEAT